MFLGQIFPNFTANTTCGEINLYNWLGDSWGILFSHPSDFSSAGASELARLVTMLPEFAKRNTKVIGLSCEPLSSKLECCDDIATYAGYNEGDCQIPVIEDLDKVIANTLTMENNDEGSSGMLRSSRVIYFIDPAKKFRSSIYYPSETERNFNEILRVLDSLQLSDKSTYPTSRRVACLADFLVDDDDDAGQESEQEDEKENVPEDVAGGAKPAANE